MSNHPAFFPPMLATPAKELPAGDGWIHELKFDGFRIQAHVHAGMARLYSREGHDMTRRFASVLPALHSLPVKSAVIDCELIATDAHGRPDFWQLLKHGRTSPNLALVAFDLIAVDGMCQDRRILSVRRRRLAELVATANDRRLAFSCEFEDGAKLLAEAERRKLEGIVCKRTDGLYTSGPSRSWLKVKTKAWKQAHADRAKVFARG